MKPGEGLVSFITCFMSSARRGGVAQPQITLKTRRSCVDRLKVSTSHGEFEASQLDDEQPSGPAETTTPPPLHVMNESRLSPFFAALPPVFSPEICLRGAHNEIYTGQ